MAATTNPYEQVIGSAVIDTVAGGKPFDIRGEALQREAGKFTVTLVRTADSATGALKVGVFSSAQMNITIKLSSGSSYSIKGVHAGRRQWGGARAGGLQQVAAACKITVARRCATFRSRRARWPSPASSADASLESAARGGVVHQLDRTRSEAEGLLYQPSS